MQPPAMSVILVTRDHWSTLRPVMAALGEQTIADRLELVLVAPKLHPDEIDGEWHEPFAELKCLSVGPVSNRGAAASQGLRAVSAPVVAFLENHCFPMPDWAQELLSGFDEPAAATGPAVLNANPESLLSWITFSYGYSSFPPDGRFEDRMELPLHNSAYDVAALRTLDNELSHLMADERRLQQALTARGLRLVFQPRAVTRHINEATWALALGIAYCGGWKYAAQRSQSWPLWRRMLYVMASPAISLPVTRNLVRAQKRQSGAPKPGARFVLLALPFALAHAMGEAVGYVAGERESFDFIERDEFMITERLPGGRIADREVAQLLDLLPQGPGGS